MRANAKNRRPQKSNAATFTMECNGQASIACYIDMKKNMA